MKKHKIIAAGFVSHIMKSGRGYGRLVAIKCLEGICDTVLEVSRCKRDLKNPDKYIGQYFCPYDGYGQKSIVPE